MNTASITDIARGEYQTSLLTGGARWSGSDLKGADRKWSSRYDASRRALLARLLAAGLDAEVRNFKNANSRIMRVLYVGGVPVSATA